MPVILVMDGFVEVRNGGITIDEAVIDGYHSLKFRIVTHIHSDHTVNLSRSISYGSRIVGTKLTLKWLKCLGVQIPEEQQLPLSMDDSIRLSNGRLRFERCLHIPGSIQVVYERDDGTRIVYTGDFKKPSLKTPVINSDILIIDAVYGRPSYTRPFDSDIEYILNSFIEKLLREGPVHIYAYYGKIHEVMLMLRENDIVAPFILPSTHYIMTKYAEVSGLRIDDYLPLTSSEAKEAIRDKYYIYFNHYSNHFNEQYLNSGNSCKIVLSGWEFTKPIRSLSKRKWLIAFSDHSDFNGLIEYVENSKPSRLIVNKRRSNGAYEFAKYVEEKINVKTEVK